MTEISVVIPALNGGELFREVLAAVRMQAGVGEIDLVVLDSQSDDGSARWAKDAGARVREVTRSDFDHGLTRNLGASLARGRFIAFLTQDASPADPQWLAALVDAMQSEQAAGAYSRVLPRPDCSPLVRRSVEGDLVYSDQRQVKRGNPAEIDAMEPFQRRIFFHFNNVASMLDRRWLERIPFPRIPFGEDLAWAGRALREGAAVVFEPASQVLHSHESHALVDLRRHAEDARLMRTLFGYRVREGWKDALPAWRQEVYRDIEYLRRSGLRRLARAYWRLRAEHLRFFQIWGQLRGSAESVAAPDFSQVLPGGLPEPLSGGEQPN